MSWSVTGHFSIFSRNTQQDPNHAICCQREDITLLIRNFNFQLSAPLSASSTLHSYRVAFNRNSNDSFVQGSKSYPQLYTSSSNSVNETLTEASIRSTETSLEQLKLVQSQNMLLDDEGRIGPYVDFTSFCQGVRKAKDEGRIPEDAVY